ncbi:MAG: flagellar motor switch protein FliN [Actinomycetia bacterium]|nr:flagellar motor switch protein FliN [Actinomycetes bacterium]
MTTTQMLSTMAPILGVAAEHAASALPELNGWTVEHLDPQNRSSAQPPSAQAVQVEVEGLGRLVLAVAGPLARSVQVGPPPAEDLLDGLSPALAKVVASLNTSLGTELSPGEPREVGADVAMLPSTGETVTAVRLLDGESHVATLALVHLDEPEPGAEKGTEEEHEFLPLQHAPSSITGHPLELLSDVELGVTVELGRTRMLLREILQLAPGSVIELDRAAGGPVDLLVNNTLIARGEVVVIDEEFGIRITEVVGYGGSDGAKHK